MKHRLIGSIAEVPRKATDEQPEWNLTSLSLPPVRTEVYLLEGTSPIRVVARWKPHTWRGSAQVLFVDKEELKWFKDGELYRKVWQRDLWKRIPPKDK